MSEERLQEIKDSIDFQKQILMAHNMETLCVDEEQELIEEIERLNNIINELEEYIKPFLYMLNGITDRDIYEECQLEDFTMIMEKLQELKGDGK